MNLVSSNFEWLGPEPETCRWWSQSHKLGFRIHRDSSLGKRIILIKQCFSDFLDQIVLEPEAKPLDVGVGVQKIWMPGAGNLSTGYTALVCRRLPTVIIAF